MTYFSIYQINLLEHEFNISINISEKWTKTRSIRIKFLIFLEEKYDLKY